MHKTSAHMESAKEFDLVFLEMLAPFCTYHKILSRNNIKQFIQVTLRDSPMIICDNTLSRLCEPYLCCIWPRLSLGDVNMDWLIVLI